MRSPDSSPQRRPQYASTSTTRPEPYSRPSFAWSMCFSMMFSTRLRVVARRSPRAASLIYTGDYDNGRKSG